MNLILEYKDIFHMNLIIQEQMKWHPKLNHSWFAIIYSILLVFDEFLCH